jgi:sphingomyelin phosphodiesterase
LTQPASMITDLLIRTCNHSDLTVAASTCDSEFSRFGGLGPYWAQLFQKVTLETGDMQAFCHYIY